jgi:sporulation protein YlmC with PRC-barrel domain
MTGPTDPMTGPTDPMTGPTNFVIGAEVLCSDGGCGTLRQVVIDPVARALTHLVVEPDNTGTNGRLVPVSLVESSTAKSVVLNCTAKEFDALEQAEETDFVPGAQGKWGYGQEQMLSFPYFGHGLGTMSLGELGAGMLSMGINSPGMTTEPQSITRDRVPVGEVAIRRGEHIHAKDGSIGRVRGLVVDATDRHVTHVLLDEGHLWGKKDVAVPIGAIERVGAEIQVNLTKDQIKDLPPVELDQSDS